MVTSILVSLLNVDKVPDFRVLFNGDGVGMGDYSWPDGEGRGITFNNTGLGDGNSYGELDGDGRSSLHERILNGH